jgi:hypothetical protein
MMNRAYYHRVFAKITNDPADRLLLDTNEGYSGERKNVKQIFWTDFEQFSDATGLRQNFARSGSFSLFTDPQHLHSSPVKIPAPADIQPNDWLHISAWFYAPVKEWEIWWMPQMAAVFEKEGQPVKERFIRPFHVLGENEWREIGMDIRAPETGFDTLKIFLRNPRDRVALYMDDLEVEVFEE